MSYPSASVATNTKPLSNDGAYIFTVSTLTEKDMPEAYTGSGDELGFLGKIVLKRVQAMNLPITFTLGALLSVDAFTDRPGSAVILLADCLNAYKDQLVTTQKLAELYPFGFYNETALIDIIDNHMKSKTHPWSSIY